MSNKTTGLKRLINAVVYSWLGFQSAFRHEAAFRQEVFLGIILIPLALYLGESPIERAILIFSVLLLLLVELLNSAIEAVVDRIGEEKHELAGRAKDMGSAAVFLAITSLCVVWGFVLLT